jgi:hypothetical protein
MGNKEEIKTGEHAVAVDYFDLLAEFKMKYFNNSFYWVNSGNFETIQKIAIEMGLRWHTMSSSILSYESQKNLVMFPEGFFQQVDMWHPDRSFGDPVDCIAMLRDYKLLS